MLTPAIPVHFVALGISTASLLSYPPTDDAEHGDQFGKTFGGAQLGLFGFAAGLQYLVEGFNLPAQCVPLQFFNDRLSRANRKIGEQLPFDLRTILGWSLLGRVYDRQRECGIVRVRRV